MLPPGGTLLQIQHYPRYKKRVPCEFGHGEGQHLGMALNVSEGGLFVSSRFTPRVGSRVMLDLSPRVGPAATGVPARVVWKRTVHRSAHAMADGGIGLEVIAGCEAYDRFIHDLIPVLASPVERVGSGSPPEVALPCFRVRAALHGTPRTRWVEVAAASEDEAGTQALCSLGEGWRVLGGAPRGPQGGSDASSS